jgi:hypothetical protein
VYHVDQHQWKWIAWWDKIASYTDLHSPSKIVSSWLGSLVSPIWLWALRCYLVVKVSILKLSCFIHWFFHLLFIKSFYVSDTNLLLKCWYVGNLNQEDLTSLASPSASSQQLVVFCSYLLFIVPAFTWVISFYLCTTALCIERTQGPINLHNMNIFAQNNFALVIIKLL